jgi:hypothetical protein
MTWPPAMLCCRSEPPPRAYGATAYTPWPKAKGLARHRSRSAGKQVARMAAACDRHCTRRASAKPGFPEVRGSMRRSGFRFQRTAGAERRRSLRAACGGAGHIAGLDGDQAEAGLWRACSRTHEALRPVAATNTANGTHGTSVAWVAAGRIGQGQDPAFPGTQTADQSRRSGIAVLTSSGRQPHQRRRPVVVRRLCCSSVPATANAPGAAHVVPGGLDPAVETLGARDAELCRYGR